MLKSGQGIIDEAAKDFDQVIQAGWTGKLPSFSSLGKVIAGIGKNAAVQSTEFPPGVQPNIDYSAIEKDHRWRGGEAYRAA
ncbi:uncharacterized protein BDR25DRAFT_381272 [Lindgomyces ingoldianus]|uniref:Uncharacterized protein n=1 Tax=Lindgomyces ingoldianus TaxID=673940 RepID=A0ACB6QCG9_9PLEO|nr:uncharacterized protein BDR25DRAFT_381272 [Lindgomyces ingoldianus]KAF2464200.1 hypothetical protein BDR25DRAFT_381272 [Lindgomyces ingoldianus]